MPRNSDPFRIRMVGRSHDHPRYLIRDTRRLIDHYYTGRGWSRRLRDARLYHNPKLAGKTAQALTVRHLRRHEPQDLYLMTIVVGIYAPVLVSRAVLETYLMEAMAHGLIHGRCGHGPTSNSLVEVPPPVISPEEGL